jgi:4-hydroxybenzoate polyprenyltransferase
MGSKHYITIQGYIKFFTKKLRLSNPWNYKVPFLITIPYFVFLISGVVEIQPLFSILASIAVIIGVAGIGYLTNDLGDRNKDAAIAKENVSSNLSFANVLFLFLLFLSLSLFPWWYLPFHLISALLLMFQFLLFVLYAFPPFRLKEKGVWGLITDSLYAHVTPAILATYTFYKFNQVLKQDLLYFVCTLVIWQFVLGLRNILFHQLKDYESDVNSNTNTFVTNYGIAKSEALCKFILLPLEILFFAVFTAFVSCFSYLYAPLIILFWLYTLYETKTNKTEFTYRNFAYHFLDDLYIKWIPLFVLAILCFKDLSFIFLFVLHFLIFRNQIKTVILSKLKLGS